MTTWTYRWSPKRTLLGIPTAGPFLTSDKERQTVFSKVEQALFLIQSARPCSVPASPARHRLHLRVR